MKFVLQPGFPGIARIGRVPGRRPVTAALRTLKRDPDFRTLHCLLIRAAATSRAIAGRLLILLISIRRTPARLRSISARGITRDPVRAAGARPEWNHLIDKGAAGHHRVGVGRNRKGQATFF